MAWIMLGEIPASTRAVAPPTHIKWPPMSHGKWRCSQCMNQLHVGIVSSFDSFRCGTCGDVSGGIWMVWAEYGGMWKEWRTYWVIAEELDLASTYVLRLFVHYLSVFRRCGDVVVGTGNIMFLT
jgi:hypothetical protein